MQQLVVDLSLKNNEPQWLRQKRLDAFKVYERMEPPKWRRVGDGSVSYSPEWHYTDLSSLDWSKISYVESKPELVSVGERLAFHGLIYEPLATAAANNEHLIKDKLFSSVGIANKFEALNAAAWSGGVFVYVPKNLEVPVTLRAKFTGGHNRTLIILEPGAVLNYVESHEGNDYTSTDIVEVFLGEGAKLNFSSLQTHGDSFVYSKKRALASKDSEVNWFTFDAGGSIVKSVVESLLSAPGARTKNRGLFFGSGDQHFDLSTNALHPSEETGSNIFVKGALNGRATSVFKGSIVIEEQAVKCVSDLQEKVLLLSERAHSDAIPSLDIKNNDVLAAHGASVGQVDEEQLFYLMSRGLTHTEAERFMVEGFFEQVLREFPDEDLRTEIREIVRSKWSQ